MVITASPSVFMKRSWLRNKNKTNKQTRKRGSSRKTERRNIGCLNINADDRMMMRNEIGILKDQDLSAWWQVSVEKKEKPKGRRNERKSIRLRSSLQKTHSALAAFLLWHFASVLNLRLRQNHCLSELYKFVEWKRKSLSKPCRFSNT